MMNENDPQSRPSLYVRVPPPSESMMSENDPQSRPSLYVRVPPIGPGDRAAREAGYQVPPDLLADARIGQRMLIAVLGLLALIEGSVIAFYVSRLGMGRLDSQIVRLLLGAGLGVMIYRGHAWARRTLVVLLGIGGSIGVLSAVHLSDWAMFRLGAIFLACASVLQFSARIRDFMMVQRTRR